MLSPCPDLKHTEGLTALQRFMLLGAKLSHPCALCYAQASRTAAKPHCLDCAPWIPQLPHGSTSVGYSCQGFPKAQFAFILFNSYFMFHPPPNSICLQKEPRGEVQPTNKNRIITQFSSTWASPGYSLVLHDSIVSPLRPYLIG